MSFVGVRFEFPGQPGKAFWWLEGHKFVSYYTNLKTESSFLLQSDLTFTNLIFVQRVWPVFVQPGTHNLFGHSETESVHFVKQDANPVIHVDQKTYRGSP